MNEYHALDHNFYFQAEDGIRDRLVTGVQTCALPIFTKIKQKVTIDKMIKICKKEYHNFDKKYLVYKNFRDKGYIINPGIKFGCDFAVYEKGPGIDHAPYLIQVYNRNESISSTGIVLAGRLATTVRKQFILAIPKGKDKVDFLALDWWKA